MAYRISYLDTLRLPRLVAVADTLDNAHAVSDWVTAAIPEAADRLVIAEDPLLGLASQVVQPPQSMDATAGLSVLYLGGTITPASNWQATAVAGLRTDLVVIANPRRERPPAGDDETLAQIAWQRRHLWRADIALFWFEESDTDQMSLFEFATQLGNPLPMAVGVAPGFAHRTLVRAYVGHLLPDLTIHDTLPDTVAATVELVRDRARPLVRLPHHDQDPDASALSVQLAIVRLQPGPGINMLLNELVIEVGYAAGVGLDAELLARVYVGVDRLRLDPDDPLGWAELLNAGHALEHY